MEQRTCSKCHITKPLNEESFGWTDKRKVSFQTECRACKKIYMSKWRLNKQLSKDPEESRIKEMYTIKDYTEEEKREALKKAYAYIHYQAYGKPITKKQFNKIEGTE